MTTPHSNEPIVREMEPQRDIPDIQRLWLEVGWLQKVPDLYLPDAFAVGRTLVAEFDEAVECAVLTNEGDIRYQNTDLPLTVVASVTTSRIARRLGLAKTLTARQLAHAGEQGSAVAALGMFDQGFYDKVGFANSSYDYYFKFDPSALRVRAPYRAPKRFGVEDYAQLHTAMLNRKRGHGGCVQADPLTFKAEMGWEQGGFGLGYCGEADAPTPEVTHFMYLNPGSEHGPYRVVFIAYQNSAQLLELLGVLQSLADQVYSVEMLEPPELQLQVMLEQPFRLRNVSRGSKHDNSARVLSAYQFRILDVAACVAARQFAGQPVEFLLDVHDPLEELLATTDAAWRGCGGRYQVSIAQTSSARLLSTSETNPAGLPVVQASINTVTRLLFGVLPASSLAVGEGLRAPTELLSQLDEAFRLPPTRTSWDF